MTMTLIGALEQPRGEPAGVVDEEADHPPPVDPAPTERQSRYERGTSAAALRMGVRQRGGSSSSTSSTISAIRARRPELRARRWRRGHAGARRALRLRGGKPQPDRAALPRWLDDARLRPRYRGEGDARPRGAGRGGAARTNLPQRRLRHRRHDPHSPGRRRKRRATIIGDTTRLAAGPGRIS
jgi:hypothetical protein